MNIKKILIVSSILLLAGVGCAPTTAPQSAEKNNQEQKLAKVETKLDEALSAKQPENNLKTNYPSFIPEGLAIDRDSLSVNDGPNGSKIVTYTLGRQTSAEADEPWIMIQEQSKASDELSHNLTANETALENLNGYAATTEGRLGTFHQVVFTTADNTLIRITSKQFDTEALIKIAESI